MGRIVYISATQRQQLTDLWAMYADLADAITKKHADTTPFCKVRRDSSQNIPNASGTEMLWNVDVSDLLNMHSTTSNTGRITIPTGFAGLYNIKARVVFTANSTGLRQIYVMKNGAHLDTWGENDTRPPVPGDIVSVHVDVDAILAEGDYIQIYVYQTSGSGLDTLNFYCWFSVTRIAAGVAIA